MIDTASSAPNTASKLLRQLDANHEPATKQLAVIRAWLADNTPTSALKCSLIANGYGLLLKGH
ncbi:hypothetical protein BST27_20860 [Mycobacterium intermedium]|uniref:Uncharacterized protein n=1 Tax=Mycobacterium intermedium TaxID=28445 RepID=A0A1E3SGF7_MYCIE|nr:hypothetical protein [Mycobacterium intermedium]MCV6965741.1 hypothetical protein [Mycobacterium intermedium]ODR01209.1 hypothetical protein BHQ20_09755 [Mycobacterium intermedium]OPE50702.1 hypothetical protein BV508_09410 [Mycobacterium intermedium]ORA98345.1 hypothetical protein BST27_20860 [Mycobacterium intermedium]